MLALLRQAQCHVGTEGESGEHQPPARPARRTVRGDGGRIRGFAHAFIERSLALDHAAEIEAQRRNAGSVQALAPEW